MGPLLPIVTARTVFSVGAPTTSSVLFIGVQRMPPPHFFPPVSFLPPNARPVCAFASLLELCFYLLAIWVPCLTVVLTATFPKSFFSPLTERYGSERLIVPPKRKGVFSYCPVHGQVRLVLFPQMSTLCPPLIAFAPSDFLLRPPNGSRPFFFHQKPSSILFEPSPFLPHVSSHPLAKVYEYQPLHFF